MTRKPGSRTRHRPRFTQPLGFTLSAVIAAAALSSGCTSSDGASGSGGVGGKATGAGGKAAGGAPGTGGAGGTPAAGGTLAAGGAAGVGEAVGGVSGLGGSVAAGGVGGSVAVGGAGGSVGGSPGVGGATGAASKLIVVPVSGTGPDRFYGVTYDAAGNIFATGQVAASTDAAADIATVVAKFKPNGELDTTFGTGGLVMRNVAVGANGELFRGIVVQSTGKVVIAGTVEHAGAADARDRDIALARFNADGTKDTTFGTDGIALFDLSTGVVVGTGFAADSAWGLARYADDRLVVSGGQVRAGGTDTDFVILRLTANGLRDAAFGTNGLFALDLPPPGETGSNNASARDVTILPANEGIIGAGYQPLPGHNTAPVVFKVTDAGVLDSSFGVGGAFTAAVLAEQTECYAAVVQPNPTGSGYKLVTTGYGKALASETTDIVSLRLTQNGALDPTYGTNGIVRLDVAGFADNSRKIVVHPDRRVLLAGGGRPTSANVEGLVAVLMPDGQPDTAFSTSGWKPYNLGGPADFLWSLAVSPNGKTLAAVGLLGVGTAPTPATLNDDAVLLLQPL